MTKSLWIAATLWALVAVGCSSSTKLDEHLPDFLDQTRPLTYGASLCVNGPFTSKSSDLERSLVLLEEYINGSSVTADSVDQIACRGKNDCGAWVGTDASGKAIRGPVNFVVGDDDDRNDRAVSIASQLKEQDQVPAIIGTCDASSMTDVFNQVTTTDVALVSPVVSADAISDLPDRTQADITASAPGYVYRTIAPDYITVGLAAAVALNAAEPITGDFAMVRAEDETSIDCTSGSPSFCAEQVGPGAVCLVPKRFSTPPTFIDKYTEVDCGGQPDNFCDAQGNGFVCVKDVPKDASPRCSSGTCCGRQRQQKFCATVTQPKTAMVLYENDDVGTGALTTVTDFWVTSQRNTILATASFDPGSPDTFGDVLTGLFNSAGTQEQTLKGNGTLPPNHQFGDTVVFIFSQATQAALFFQEWELQLPSLPAGSDRVFWVSTDEVRSTLLTDQVSTHTLRNLYVVNPYLLIGDSGTFFTDLFKKRWNKDPDQYAGNIFDAGLLLVMANERAGLLRQRGGTLSSTSVAKPNLDLNAGADIKNSLPFVAGGCSRQAVSDVCPPTAVGGVPENFPALFSALGNGSEIVTQGVTGDLSFSPAGDRQNQMALFKVASDGANQGFFQVKTLDPFKLAINLKK